MRDVFTGRETAQVGLYQSMLENAGIPCFIRNQHDGGSLSGFFGPTLCVTLDEDYARAVEIIASATAGESASGPDWKCPDCGADVPDTFDSCWRCSASRPA